MTQTELFWGAEPTEGKEMYYENISVKKADEHKTCLGLTLSGIREKEGNTFECLPRNINGGHVSK